MKSIYFFYLLCTLAIMNACKSTSAPGQNKSCVLEGKYLNYTVLKDCPNVLPGEVANFALEFNFKSKDTVDVYNGFERFRLPYTGPDDSCTYTLQKATALGDIKFMVQGDSMLQVMDSAWTHLKGPSVFRRIDEKLPWGFSHYLNECVLVGTWILNKEGIDKDHKVIFLRNGQVDGMKPYLAYEICYAGDCLEETDPYSNTIDFLDDRNNHTTFSIVIKPGRRSIKFYSIGDPVPDEKGGRKIGALAFELTQ